MDSLPMSELLCRARAGDEDALGILLLRYRPQLQALAQRQLESAVKPRVSASDVVQQTCLEAHQDLPGFRVDLEDPQKTYVQVVPCAQR